MSYYRQGPFRPGSAGIQLGVPRMTPCVKAILVTCAAVWLIQLLANQLFALNLPAILGLVPLRVISGWVFQPVTYMFLHDPTDPMHLILNMLMLWMFGSEIEQYMGSRSFAWYWLLCGVGGGLAATVLGLIQGGMAAQVPTIGASGALYGLFVAYGTIFAERTILFMLIFPMKAKTVAIIMVALNFFNSLYHTGSGVSYVAHLGGALVGFLYLKRVWRVGALYRELRWRLKRRRFRVMPPRDPDDRWTN